jgi:hypothetical protein
VWNESGREFKMAVELKPEEETLCRAKDTVDDKQE